MVAMMKLLRRSTMTRLHEAKFSIAIVTLIVHDVPVQYMYYCTAYDKTASFEINSEKLFRKMGQYHLDCFLLHYM